MISLLRFPPAALLLLPVLLAHLANAQDFNPLYSGYDYEPTSASSGDELTVTGSFDLDEDYTVSIGGSEVTVSSVTETTLTVTLDDNTASGELEIQQSGGAAITFPIPFQLTRDVSVSFDFPPGVNPAGYFITPDGFTVDKLTSGGESLVVELPADRPHAVWAIRDRDDPIFLTMVGLDESSAVIDAASTASAMGYLSPALTTRDGERGDMILSILNANNAAAGQVISDLSGDGRSFFGNPVFEDAMVDLLETTLEVMSTPVSPLARRNPRSSQKDNTIDGTEVRIYDLISDRTGTIPVTTPELKATVKANEDAPGEFILSVEVDGDYTPNDWQLYFYDIDPDELFSGFATLENLDEDHIFDSQELFQNGSVAASLFTDNINVLGVAVKWVKSLLPSVLPSEKSLANNQVSLPLDFPTVYCVEAYSGNLWYGTDFFLLDHSIGLASASQTFLINRLPDGERKWNTALAVNLIQTTIDLFGAVVDLTIFDDASCLNDFVNLQIDNTGGLLVSQLGGTGDFTKIRVLELLKSYYDTTFAIYGNKLIKLGIENGAEAIAEGFGTTITNTLNITKKLSFIGNTLERFYGYILPSTLAVERFVIVVGNPFDPTIRSFRPVQGRTDDRVVVTCSNLPESQDDFTVSFCRFDSTDGSSSGELQAEILAYDGFNVTIAVPDGWSDEFGSQRAAGICIEDNEGNLTTSYALKHQAQQFVYTPPPEVDVDDPDVITPRIVAAGDMVHIRGNYFDGKRSLHNEAVFDGDFGNPLPVFNASETEITVRVPDNLEDGAHTVAISLDGYLTDAIPFTVANPKGPAKGFGPQSLSITISKLDFSNAPDGEISIYEAFAIANGTLGRAIEQHAEEEDPVIPRETDYVHNDENSAGGPSSADTIFLGVTTPEGDMPVIALTSPLPAITNGDSFNLSAIFDGSGLGNQDGFLIEDQEGITLENMVLRNFGLNGVHIVNSNNIELKNVRIENCGLNGIMLSEGARNNRFLNTFAIDCIGYGLVLDGPEVKYNIFELSQVSTLDVLGAFEYNGDGGVLIDNGASYNQVTPGTVRFNEGHGVLVRNGSNFNIIGENDNVVPRYSDIIENNGHGVFLQSGITNSVIRWIAPAGNNGDGIRLEGDGVTDNQLDGIYTGIDYFNESGAVELNNQGAGIRLKDGPQNNLIGSLTPGGFGERSSIVGNDDSGIILEGSETAFNKITRLNIGDTVTSVYPAPVGYSPSGEAGIHIRDGAHDNDIGEYHGFLDLHIFGQPDGAGILIEGFTTHSNRIWGVQLGSEHGFSPPAEESKCKVGIHLRNGTYGNTIGQPGEQVFVLDPPPNPFDLGAEYRGYNVISNCTEAGILIESAGADQASDPSQEPNRIFNNYIGLDDFKTTAPNTVGIKITGEVLANEIGSVNQDEQNLIRYNTDAGIKFEDATGDFQNLTVLLNNDISESGNHEPDPGDPADGPPIGVGILVQNSQGVSVVSRHKSNAQISDNILGVYIDGGGSNLVSTLNILNNEYAGIYLKDTTGNYIGDRTILTGNSIVGNGLRGDRDAGIVIDGGQQNTVQANSIGVSRGRAPQPNDGDGVLLIDSASNRIGSIPGRDDNVIGSNNGNGVRLTGSGSTGNIISGNYIGVTSFRDKIPNDLSGVLIENGATRNLVGGQGLEVIAGSTFIEGRRNIIVGNDRYGVEVDGASGNSIVRNRIYDNTLGGIGLTNSGNNDQLPPIRGVLRDNILRGEVPSLTDIPEGSLIEIFDNPPSMPAIPIQGRRYLGRTTVDSTGRWTLLSPPPFSNTLTMTATHPTTGDTSTFGFDIEYDLELAVGRADGEEPQTRNFPTDQLDIAVLTIAVSAENGTAIAGPITFTAQGTLDEVNDIESVSLAIDADYNGVLDENDFLISDEGAYDADNGTVTFNTGEIILEEDVAQYWVLLYRLKQPLADGVSFSAELAAPSHIPATYIQPIDVPAVHVGMFPIESDTFIAGGSGIDIWRSEHFNETELADEAISGLFADPDGDGVINLLEYALNLNPRSRDVGPLVEAFLDGGAPAFAYDRLLQRDDLTYIFEVSDDLSTWRSGPGVWFEAATTPDADSERVEINLVDGGSLPSFGRLRVQLD
ncbi:right-handed parallel beta-helix repeat-containing protein [Cerasicoccus frondis]|uniref:right-handed parallel beta-helix repeat-containing protein n=1 Tax=Cerasicoccus frondis TaxID=490090 RepID=UPI002852A067|nr:right-handed parallel beta-helix repeat-containing protein [Cerasicoccus frondis]